MNRTNAYATCSECENRRLMAVHPADTADEIRVACPVCRDVTTHSVGGVRFA